MSVVTPRDLPTEMTVITNGDTESEVYNVDTEQNEKVKKSTDKTYFQGAEVLANTAYKDRVKTKVLWTGPLSVVSTPTSLDGSEDFTDWDYYIIQVSLTSDVLTFIGSTMIGTVFANTSEFFSDSGTLVFKRLSDTTFELLTKTVASGNISRIIGVSL